MSVGEAVHGYCPMGCGATLALGMGGRIYCSRAACPNPHAVDQLVADTETEHIVRLEPTEFTVRHPLRERLDDALIDCTVHARIHRGDRPTVRAGTYRVSTVAGRLHWQAVNR